MTIVVFLLDTSASMYQRTYLGETLLDEAKGAVETFVKLRQRSTESRGDRYMLLTFDAPPGNVKAGWKENLAKFMSELKNLRSDNPTCLGPALKHTFDLLNINRMQTGIDMYGQGRNPFFLEPTMIVLITDGGRPTEHLILPMDGTVPGAELTREPFRWDQRLFALVLRLPGTPVVERDVRLVPRDAPPIDAMCEVTGGRSYAVTSRRVLMQCVESLVQKVHSGVVINFEKVGSDPAGVEPPEDGCEEGAAVVNVFGSSAWHSCRRLIYVPRPVQRGAGVGFWPIPENFWPDSKISELPPRTAHPNVKFSCLNVEPIVIKNLPFDKYELEPSPLTQFILARKQPSACWQVFVSSGHQNSKVAHPFGYLKASTKQTHVNLFVMPYNYPVLMPLLEDLLKTHRNKPTDGWRVLFRTYLRAMPPYYAGPLRRALTCLGVPASLLFTLVPESLDNWLSVRVASYLKRLKIQAKEEFERICNDLAAKSTVSKPREEITVAPISPFRKDYIANPHQQYKFVTFRDQLNDFAGSTVGVLPPSGNQGQSWASKVHEVPRACLLDHLAKLRAAFYSGDSAVLDQDRHALPVSQMGNYLERLKELPTPLRAIESAPVRQHLFGNPFKIDRRMVVDEADMDAGGSVSVNRGACALDPAGGGKRRPMTRDAVARRRRLNRSPSPASTAPAYCPQPVSKLVALPALPALPVLIPAIFAIAVPIPAPIPTPVAVESSAARKPEGPQVLTVVNGNVGTTSLASDPRIVAAIIRQLLESEHNSKVRNVLVKEIRRPGKRNALLLATLATLQGDGAAKRRVVLDAIEEARRLKRRKLVELLEKFALECC